MHHWIDDRIDEIQDDNRLVRESFMTRIQWQVLFYLDLNLCCI